MKFGKLSLCAGGIALASTIALLPALAFGAKGDKGASKFKPEGEIVEMFSSIKSGDIEVTFIPKDATEATVLFKNKTDKPLAIKLPDAFAGVPVLAQAPAGGAIGGPAGRVGGSGGVMQGVGGGFGGNPGAGMMGGGAMPMGGVVGGGGGMMGGMRGMGGFGGGMIMNVGPDKIMKVKVPVVCLEHGKKDPNPKAKYEIRAIETFTKTPEVIELCKMIGRGEVTQNTAQAAAWHLASGVSFEQLAYKNRAEHHNGSVEKFFTAKELQTAVQVVSEANKRGEAASKEASSKAKSLNDN